MFSTGFDWRGFEVELSKATAARVADTRAFDGAVFFDNGRQFIEVGAASPIPDLLEAWAAFPLPAGYIGPSLAQLALLRGEAVAFDDVAGRLTIGGRVLVGTAGRAFRFSGLAGADQWLLVNRKRGASEVAVMAGLPELAREAAKAEKREKLAARAVAVVRNAAKAGEAGIREALIREADWYMSKWA